MDGITTRHTRDDVGDVGVRRLRQVDSFDDRKRRVVRRLRKFSAREQMGRPVVVGPQRNHVRIRMRCRRHNGNAQAFCGNHGKSRVGSVVGTQGTLLQRCSYAEELERVLSQRIFDCRSKVERPVGRRTDTEPSHANRSRHKAEPERLSFHRAPFVRGMPILQWLVGLEDSTHRSQCSDDVLAKFS